MAGLQRVVSGLHAVDVAVREGYPRFVSYWLRAARRIRPPGPRIAVATASAAKLSAVSGSRSCYRRQLPPVCGIPGVTSGIQQPIGMAETLRGAMNRLNGALALLPPATDVVVAIESGIVDYGAVARLATSTSASDWHDVAWVVVHDVGPADLMPLRQRSLPVFVRRCCRARWGRCNDHRGGRAGKIRRGRKCKDPHLTLTGGLAPRHCCSLVPSMALAQLAQRKRPPPLGSPSHRRGGKSESDEF